MKDLNTTDAPYANAARDRDTGNTLIALSADAASDLRLLLGTIDVKDLVRNPDANGLSTDDANRLAGIARTLSDLLARL